MIISGFKQLARWAIRRPKRMLLFAALVTLAAAPGILKLKLRTDGHALVSPTAPEAVMDAAVRAHFGIHDQVVVLIRPGGTNDIFNAVTVQLVRDLTDEFKTLPGVAAADVTSLATEPSFRMRPGTLNHQMMLEPPLKTAGELAQLRDDVRRIELYTGTFVSMDGKSTVILVGVPEGADRTQFQARILQLIAAQKNAPDEIAMTGAPVAESLLGTEILGGLGVPGAWLGDRSAGLRPGSHAARVFLARHIGLVPLAALVMMLVLLACFRNPLAALLPLPGVVATMLFVFGLMGWLGVPIYLTTAVMPVLLTVISVTNDIYLFSRYFTLLRERNVTFEPPHTGSHNGQEGHIALLEETFEKLTRPVVCTSLAAVAGFLSFVFSPLAPVRMFGLFTGLGALFGLFLSLTVVPALLAIANPNWFCAGKKLLGAGTPEKHALSSAFASLGQFVVTHRWPVIGITVAIMALTPLGLCKLVVQDSWTSGFGPDSEFRRVTQSVNDNFFGMHLLFVCAKAPKIIEGEISRSGFTDTEIALPVSTVGNETLIAGSPITLSAGDSAPWPTHIEMVKRTGGTVFARLANREEGTNFFDALALAGKARYSIPVRTHFDPNLIRDLGDLGAFIRERRDDAVGGVLGPSDYLATSRFMSRPDDPRGHALPGDAGETKLMWDYYALALGPQRLHELVDTNYWESLTTVFLKDANFVGTAKLTRDLRDYERAHLARNGISIDLAGDVAVSQSLIHGIVSTQLQSLFWSLLGIFLVTALLGGSWRRGFLCLLPSLLAVVVKFAVMGGAGIPLGVATSMFAAMTLGIGVNCAIHLLEGFDQARAAGKSPPDALDQALRLTGPPALVNTLAVSLGFGVLMLSQVPANARLGILLVLGLVNCFVVSVILLPVWLGGRGTSRNIQH